MKRRAPFINTERIEKPLNRLLARAAQFVRSEPRRRGSGLFQHVIAFAKGNIQQFTVHAVTQ